MKESNNLRIDFGVSERAFFIMSVLIGSVFLFALYHLIQHPDNGTIFRFVLICVIGIFNMSQTLPRRKNFIEWSDERLKYKVLKYSGDVDLNTVKSITYKDAVVKIIFKDGREDMFVIDQATSPRQKTTIKSRFEALSARFPENS